MTDYFKILQLPRLPWIENTEVSKKHLELSKLWHPDKFHTADQKQKNEAEARYSEINQAQQIISNPSSRIRHLLTLESSSPPSVVDQLPNAVMDLFMEVEKILRQFESCIKEKETLSNPLLKMNVVQRAMDLAEPTQVVMEKLRGYQDQLLNELKSLSSNWSEPTPRSHLASLEEIYRSLTHIDKWIQKINEKQFQAQMP